MSMSIQAEDDRLIAYWWKYDDKSYGFALLDMREKRHMRLQQAKYLNDRKEFLGIMEDNLRHGSLHLKEGRKDERSLVKKKLKLHSGLEYFQNHDKPKRDKERGEYGLQELRKFLQSCGAAPENCKEVLRLSAGSCPGTVPE